MMQVQGCVLGGLLCDDEKLDAGDELVRHRLLDRT